MRYISWGNWRLEEPDEIIELDYSGLVRSIRDDIRSAFSESGPVIGFMGPGCAGKTTLRNRVGEALRDQNERQILIVSEELAGYPRRAIPERGFYGKLDVMDYFDPEVQQNPDILALLQKELRSWDGKTPANHQLCYNSERLGELVQWILSRQPPEKCFDGWYREESKNLDLDATFPITQPDAVLMDGIYLTERNWYPRGFFSQIFLLLVGDEVYLDRALGREEQHRTQDQAKVEMFMKYDRLVMTPTMETYYPGFMDWVRNREVTRVFDMRDFSHPKELVYQAQFPSSE